MREKIDVTEYAPTILRELPKGVLLTARAGGRANPMTIGWGTLGVEWGKPLFVAYVRSSRFTYGLIEKSGEFTVSVPMRAGEKDHDRRISQILAVCGSKSGRDLDKVAELGLTLVEGEEVGAEVEAAVGDAALHAVDDLREVGVSDWLAGELLDGALGVGKEVLEPLGGVREGGGDLGDDGLDVHGGPFFWAPGARSTLGL